MPSDLEFTKKTLRENLQNDFPAVLLIRHAERFRMINPGDVDVDLTENGRKEAEELGLFLLKTFHSLRIRGALSSPYVRTTETAKRIVAPFLGPNYEPQPEQQLFLPKFAQETFDLKSAERFMMRNGLIKFAKRLYDKNGYEKDPPFENTQDFTKFFLKHLDEPGLLVLTSHDFTLAGVLHLVFGFEIRSEVVPGFLGSVLFWKEGERYFAAHKDDTVEISPRKL